MSKRVGLGDYKEMIIEEPVQAELLALYRSEQRKLHPLNVAELNSIIGVKVVHYPQGKKLAAEWLQKKKWADKEAKKLNNDAIAAFEKVEKAGYEALQHYVRDLSRDYYGYVEWLFGGKLTPQGETEPVDNTSTTVYNSLPFWLYEVEPDHSDAHLKSLSQLLTILDNSFIGTLELDEHAKLWHSLISHPNSIYLHLLGAAEESEGKFRYPNSLWGLLCGEHEAQRDEIKAMVAGSEEGSRAAKYQSVLSMVETVLGRKDKKRVSVESYLIEQLVSLSLGGVSKSLQSAQWACSETVKRHILSAANLFGEGVIRQVKIRIPVSHMQRFLNLAEKHAPKIKSAGLVTSKGNKLSFPSGNWSEGADNIHKEMVDIHIALAFKSDAEAVEFAKQLRERNGTIAGKVIAKHDVLDVSADAIDPKHLEDIEKLFNDEKYLYREEMLANGKGLLMNGTLAVLNHLELHSLKEQLAKHKGDQRQRELLEWQINRAYFDIIVGYAEALVHGSKMAYTMTTTYRLFELKNDSLFNLLEQSAKTLSQVGKAVSIIDSVLDISKAWGQLEGGDKGSGRYFMGSAIGIALLYFAPAIPVVGQLALIFAAMWLKSHYDNGASWDEMEKWLNRCLLGNQNLQKWLPPYPVTDTGMYLSNQDYYIAMRGGRCEALHDKTADYKTYSDMGYGAHMTTGMDIYYNLYLELDLPDYIRKGNISELEGEIVITHYPGEQITQLKFWSDNKAERLAFELLQPSKDKRLEDGLFSETLPPLDVRGKEFYKYKDDNTITNQDDDIWHTMLTKVTGRAIETTTAKNDLIALEDDGLPQQGLFEIQQLIGRVRGEYRLSCAIRYWPKGTKPKKDESQPLPLGFFTIYDSLGKEQGDEDVTEK